MDFMNFMNQINSCGCNTGCNTACNTGYGGSSGYNQGYGGSSFLGGGSGILPWLLLAGLSGNNYNNSNNFSGGTLACYPNNYGSGSGAGYGYGYGYPYIFPTNSYSYGLKYRTRRVRQAYMEVPVSTYHVAQPMPCMVPCGLPYGSGNTGGGCPQPTLMNIVPTANSNNNSNGLLGFGNLSGIWPLLLICGLLNNKNRGCCCQQPQPQPKSCGCEL